MHWISTQTRCGARLVCAASTQLSLCSLALLAGCSTDAHFEEPPARIAERLRDNWPRTLTRTVVWHDPILPRIPLQDLTGAGWNGLDDYVRRAPGDAQALLYQVRLRLDPILERVMPIPQTSLDRAVARAAEEERIRKLVPHEEPATEEGICSVRYHWPDTPEYQAVVRELHQVLNASEIKANGLLLSNADAWVIDGTGAYTFFAARNEDLSIVVSIAGESKTLILPKPTKCPVVRVGHRYICDVLGVLSVDPKHVDRSVFLSFMDHPYLDYAFPIHWRKYMPDFLQIERRNRSKE